MRNEPLSRCVRVPLNFFYSTCPCRIRNVITGRVDLEDIQAVPRVDTGSPMHVKWKVAGKGKGMWQSGPALAAHRAS